MQLLLRKQFSGLTTGCLDMSIHLTKYMGEERDFFSPPGYINFCRKMTPFLQVLILTAFALLLLFPISFATVEPSSSLFSLYLLSPFLCVARILLSASATEHAENPSIDSLLQDFRQNYSTSPGFSNNQNIQPLQTETWKGDG